VLPHQQADTLTHPAAQHVFVRSLGHVQDVGEMGIPRAALIAEDTQLLQRARAHSRAGDSAAD
jgi:hypothetical protein